MDLLLPIALILVGLALVAVEVTLVPGFQVVGVLGVLGAGTGVVYAFVVFGAIGGLIATGGTVVAGAALLYLLWESGAWSRLVLTDSLRRDADADADEAVSRARLIGQVGTAVTPLRPAGVAEVDGTRVEVQTEGAFVASGSRVRVLAMDRRGYVVRLEEDRA